MLSLLEKDEKPREKFLQNGAESMSDAELLAILIRSGLRGRCAMTIAKDLLSTFGTLRGIINAEQTDFCALPGLGVTKYIEFQAAFAIIQRHLKQSLIKKELLVNADKVEQYLLARHRDKPLEVFSIITLDTQYRILNFHELFHGTLNAAAIYPREIVKLVIKVNAAAIILVHNHPSGNSEPSDADKMITKDVIHAMATIDVKVLDHFIVGDNNLFSFAKSGLI